MHQLRPRPFRQPLLAALAVVAMGIGIGSVGGTFAVARSFLGPLPLEEPDRLVHLATTLERFPGRFLALSREHLDALAEHADGLVSVGGYRSVWTHVSGPEGAPESVRSVEATASLFRVLGVEPLHGRWLRPADEVSGAETVVVLSYAVWRRRYGGDPGLVGRRITVNGAPATVVGIMPESFRFPNDHYLWLPPAQDAWFVGVGRLAEGRRIDRLLSELRAVDGVVARPEDVPPRPLVARPYAEEAVPEGEVRAVRVLVLMGVMVLVAACLNVATLLLLRALHARRETAVRLALGAPRRALVGERIVEALVLAALGGVLGAGLTFAGPWTIQRAFRDSGTIAYSAMPYWVDFRFHSSEALVAPEPGGTPGRSRSRGPGSSGTATGRRSGSPRCPPGTSTSWGRPSCGGVISRGTTARRRPRGWPSPRRASCVGT